MRFVPACGFAGCFISAKAVGGLFENHEQDADALCGAQAKKAIMSAAPRKSVAPLQRPTSCEWTS
ncbi:MAG TPA: hypothetical protein VFF84_07770 [Sphingobium sp.]|nr:hypothetical protein [Sphingobium sp.]